MSLPTGRSDVKTNERGDTDVQALPRDAQGGVRVIVNAILKRATDVKTKSRLFSMTSSHSSRRTENEWQLDHDEAWDDGVGDDGVLSGAMTPLLGAVDSSPCSSAYPEKERSACPFDLELIITEEVEKVRSMKSLPGARLSLPSKHSLAMPRGGTSDRDCDLQARLEIATARLARSRQAFQPARPCPLSTSSSSNTQNSADRRSAYDCSVEDRVVSALQRFNVAHPRGPVSISTLPYRRSVASPLLESADGGSRCSQQTDSPPPSEDSRCSDKSTRTLFMCAPHCFNAGSEQG